MAYVKSSVVVNAPLEFAFEYTSDFRNVPKWMFGVKKFEPTSGQTSGVGASFTTAIDLGLAKIPMQMEATAWDAPHYLAYKTTKAILGLRATTEWSFEAETEGTTRISSANEYLVGGGLAGKPLDKIIQVMVGPVVRHVEKHLRELIESAWADSVKQPR